LIIKGGFTKIIRVQKFRKTVLVGYHTKKKTEKQDLVMKGSTKKTKKASALGGGGRGSRKPSKGVAKDKGKRESSLGGEKVKKNKKRVLLQKNEPLGEHCACVGINIEGEKKVRLLIKGGWGTQLSLQKKQDSSQEKNEDFWGRDEGGTRGIRPQARVRSLALEGWGQGVLRGETIVCRFSTPPPHKNQIPTHKPRAPLTPTPPPRNPPPVK